MFIRKVATRHRSSGGSYSSFRLVRNVGTDSGSRQIHLLNLGADLDVPPQRWPELVQLILDCDSSQLPLKPPDPPLLALAQRIHRCLLERSALHPGDDLATVRLDSLDHSHVRSVGAERLVLHALDQLAFRDALEAAGTSPRDARVASALVLARMLQPSSERAACDWLNSRSATLAAALQKRRVPRLRGQAKAPLPTVIMDAGLSTEENTAWLRAHGYDWITVQCGREGPPPRPADAVFRTRQGRIKERHSKVARQYEVAVRPGQKKKGKRRLDAADDAAASRGRVLDRDAPGHATGRGGGGDEAISGTDNNSRQQPVQELPATVWRRRQQVSGQLSRLVPASRTLRKALPTDLPDCRPDRSENTFRQLSLLILFVQYWLKLSIMCPINCHASS